MTPAGLPGTDVQVRAARSAPNVSSCRLGEKSVRNLDFELNPPRGIDQRWPVRVVVMTSISARRYAFSTLFPAKGCYF